MSDIPHISDDISALWGPTADGILDPEPPPADRTRRPGPDRSVVDADRLQAIEQRLDDGLGGLVAVIEAHRADMEASLRDQLARMRSEAGTEVESRLAQMEAQLARRLDQIARQGAETVARAAPAAKGGPVDALRAELLQRVQAMEQQLKEDMSAIGRSVDSQSAQWVKRAELTDLPGGAGQDQRRAGAELERRLRLVEEAMTALASKVEAMAAERSSPLAALRSDVRFLQEELTALRHVVCDTDAGRAGRRRRGP